MKNFEDAEDLAQEVFIEVYQKLSQFRGESSVKTWLYRITINKCLQHLRSRKAYKRTGEVLTMDQKMPEIAVFDHPGILLENKELGKILFAMMEKLPENQRVAFTLHKVESLSHEEISVIMDKSIASVESLIHRAKLHLKANLKTYYENI